MFGLEDDLRYEIKKLKKRNKELLKALNRVIITCDNFGHKKGEYHSGLDKCSVEEMVEKALDYEE